MLKPKVIAVVGPTASGKTSLGIYLAQKFDGEIISADSRQVYKGLDIGTGKVTTKEMLGVPHHLLDVASPKRQFTVDDFVTRAQKVIQKTPLSIVVGGTGLYADVLLGRISYPNVPPNQKLRARLEKKSTTQLFALLRTLDPRRASNIEQNHKRRLIRAIEIAKAIGKSPDVTPEKKYKVLWLGLSPAPEKLQKNIHTRLQSRLRSGMVAEAKRLHKAGLSYKRMDGLGLEYRYLAKLLKKEITEAQFEIELERAIWQYAKRQIRWFKRNTDIQWVSSQAKALQLAKAFLSR